MTYCELINDLNGWLFSAKGVQYYFKFVNNNINVLIDMNLCDIFH